MSERVASMVDGESVPGAPDATLTSVNPARTSQVVAEVALADPETLVDACRAARRAQREWAATPAPLRGRAIAYAGRLVEANARVLARLVTREVGKPYRESLGEVREVVDTCDFFLGEGRRLYGQTVPSEMPDKQLFTFRNPLGVAVIITAGNFPVAVPAWYLVPALLAGNAVVWKPAEYSAATALALYRLFHHAGIPDGVLNLVIADGPATFTGLGRALEAEVVDKVGFTGSTEVGSAIGELCGRHLQSPCLELGGKNPLVVTPSADLDLAVEGALFSGFGTAGQRCTSLGTAIVHQDVHREFLRRFTVAIEAAPVGDPFSDVLYGPMISEQFAGRYERFLGWIQDDHHRVSGSSAVGRITREAPRRGFLGDPDAGLYYHPVIVDGIRPEDDLFRHETFGPVVGVTTYRTLDEAVELANAPGYGLSAAIYSSDPLEVFRFRAGIGAGMLSVNNSTSGAEAHLPFGGNGRSGNGSRLSGMWVLDQFTRWQAVNWDYSGRLQKAQMDVAEPVPKLDYRLPD
ncbi:MAG TPA: aldehyde dehydrogenase family protein [Micromonosporaceae bacterium]